MQVQAYKQENEYDKNNFVPLNYMPYVIIFVFIIISFIIPRKDSAVAKDKGINTGEGRV